MGKSNPMKRGAFYHLAGVNPGCFSQFMAVMLICKFFLADKSSDTARYGYSLFHSYTLQKFQ